VTDFDAHCSLQYLGDVGLPEAGISSARSLFLFVGVEAAGNPATCFAMQNSVSLLAVFCESSAAVRHQGEGILVRTAPEAAALSTLFPSIHPSIHPSFLLFPPFP
jgi:hypothetical protein